MSKYRGLSFFLFALTILAAMALAPLPGASAEFRAVDPEEIAQDLRIDEASVYVSPIGEQIVIWKVQDGPERPLAARSRSGAGFGAVDQLSLTANAGLPRLVFNQQGKAYAIWPIHTTGAPAESSTRPPGGTFGPALPAGGCNAGISAATSPGGKLALACFTYRTTSPNYQFGFGFADQVQSLVPSNFSVGYAYDPRSTQTAWGKDGTLAIALYQEATIGTEEVRVMVRDPSGSSTPTELVKSATSPLWAYLAGLAVFPNGTAAVAYSHGMLGTNGAAKLNLRAPGSAPFEVDLPGEYPGGLQVDNSGTLHLYTSADGGDFIPEYSALTVNAAGVLSTPIPIPLPNPDSYLSQFLVHPDGSEIAIFVDGSDNSVWARRRAAGSSSFGSAIKVVGGGARSPMAALTSSDDVLVVWTREAGADDDRVLVGGLDAGTPPVLSVEQPPTEVVAKVPVRFAASAKDSMGIRSITWKYGDGSSAAGGVVSHAFARAGQYEVVVTATDRAGNSTSKRHTVKVVGAGDPAARLRVSGPKKVKFKVLKRKGVRFRVRSNEPVRLLAQLIARTRSARISAVGDLVLAERSLAVATAQRAVKLKPAARLLGKRPRKLRLKVRFTATDQAGNQTVVTRALKVKP